MIITTQVINGKHFTTIQHDNATMTIMTDNGLPTELAQEAAEMRKKAARLTRQADTIKAALIELGAMP